MLRALIYNKSLFPISETFIYQQVLYIKDEYHVTLLGRAIKHAENFPLEGVDIKVLKERNPLSYRVINRLRTKLGLPVKIQGNELTEAVNTIKSVSPDLIHVHFGYNAVHIFPAVKKLQIPLIVSFHGVDASPMMAKNKAYLGALPEILDYCSGILVSSMHMVDVLNFTADQRKKVTLFPYGVDAEKFKPSVRDSKCSMIRILHSGRLVPKKGVPDLIKTFARVVVERPNVQLDIVGDGTEMTTVRHLVNDSQLGGKINLHGEQSHINVHGFIKNTDIFVLNSRTASDGDMEGSPVSILEAMSMAKAVISTRHAGIPELIQNGVNGIVVNERDNDGLLNALETMIDDSEMRRRLGASARETVESNYSGQKMKDKFLNIYRRALR